MTYADGKEEYEGQWVTDLREGVGRQRYGNGDVYDGDWIAGRRDGFGVTVYRSGEEYDGCFEDDAEHGEGIFKGWDGEAGSAHGYAGRYVVVVGVRRR
jgi:hypothetical protein